MEPTFLRSLFVGLGMGALIGIPALLKSTNAYLSLLLEADTLSWEKKMKLYKFVQRGNFWTICHMATVAALSFTFCSASATSAATWGALILIPVIISMFFIISHYSSYTKIATPDFHLNTFWALKRK